MAPSIIHLLRSWKWKKLFSKIVKNSHTHFFLPLLFSLLHTLFSISNLSNLHTHLYALSHTHTHTHRHRHINSFYSFLSFTHTHTHFHTLSHVFTPSLLISFCHFANNRIHPKLNIWIIHQIWSTIKIILSLSTAANCSRQIIQIRISFEKIFKFVETKSECILKFFCWKIFDNLFPGESPKMNTISGIRFNKTIWTCKFYSTKLKMRFWSSVPRVNSPTSRHKVQKQNHILKGCFSVSPIFALKFYYKI